MIAQARVSLTTVKNKRMLSSITRQNEIFDLLRNSPLFHSQFPLSSVVGFGCPSPPPESNAGLQQVFKEQDSFDSQLLPLGWVGVQQPAQAPPARRPCRAVQTEPAGHHAWHARRGGSAAHGSLSAHPISMPPSTRSWECWPWQWPLVR